MATVLTCAQLQNAVATASANRLPPVKQLALQVFAIAAFLINPDNAGFVFAANYGGNPPNFSPTTAGAIAFDTSTQQRWTWVNGVWQ